MEPGRHQDRFNITVANERPQQEPANGKAIANVGQDREAAEAHGCCPSCGQQLYRFKPQVKGLLALSPWKGAHHDKKENFQKIPLNVPMLVERGQCLACKSTHSASEETTSSQEDKASHLHHTVETHEDSHPSPLLVPTGMAVYKGSFNSLGEKHGKGEMTWGNGDVYRGSFLNGHRHGPGILLFAATSNRSQAQQYQAL